MAELAYAVDLKSTVHCEHTGSSPVKGTMLDIILVVIVVFAVMLFFTLDEDK